MIRINRIHEFVSDADQLGICKNLNASSKYYIGFHDVPHFSGLWNPGMDKDSDVREVVRDLLYDFDLSGLTTESFEVISDNGNCTEED